MVYEQLLLQRRVGNKGQEKVRYDKAIGQLISLYLKKSFSSFSERSN